MRGPSPKLMLGDKVYGRLHRFSSLPAQRQSIGKSLGLEVTAEGVEDSASMKRLKELGCTYGQGYLFGRPMPAADAGRLLVETGAAVMAAE